MEIYDYTNTSNCFICGNINGKLDEFINTIANGLDNLSNFVKEEHPKEKERQERVAKRMQAQRDFFDGMRLQNIGIQDVTPTVRRSKRYKSRYCENRFNDSVIVVNGCNTFGKHDSKYYYDKLKNLNNVLRDNKTHLLLVRGNDDPKYFTDGLLDMSNIKTIKDYSILRLNNFNCLCIGGYTSMDRQWRKKQETILGKKLFFENENFTFNEKEIDEILNEWNIACIITPSCPSFSYPSINTFKNSAWVKHDKTLFNEVKEERLSMDKIYDKFIKSDKKPYMWVYSRFNTQNIGLINDIIFYSLRRFEFVHFNEQVKQYFKVNFSKNLKENDLIAQYHLFGKKDYMGDELEEVGADVADVEF